MKGSPDVILLIKGMAIYIGLFNFRVIGKIHELIADIRMGSQGVNLTQNPEITDPVGSTILESRFEGSSIMET
jgi:hypothetical protein